MFKPLKSDANQNPGQHSNSSGHLEKAETMAILANRLFEFYHDQELASNAKTFLAGVVELFCHYPDEIIRRAVSPVFGLPVKHKFPPRIQEIREFLEEEMKPIRRQQERDARAAEPKALPAPPRPAPKNKQFTYAEHLKRAQETGAGMRPVGAFDRGSYLGPS